MMDATTQVSSQGAYPLAFRVDAQAPQADQIAAASRRWAEAIRSWHLDWVTGIYPLEMAFFLAACEVNQIAAIVESGRGDHAYSTHVLGEFSNETGIPVCSIDATDPHAKPFARSLQKYRKLELITGDSFAAIPPACRGKTRIALLVDGPKKHQANNLSYAASQFADIRLIAHHNCHLTTDWGRQFASLFSNAMHYESFVDWGELKEWEARQVIGYNQASDEDPVGRSLETSSLAVGIPGPTQPPWFFHGKAKHNPYWLLFRWRFSVGKAKKVQVS
jgi:hypothetical protein